MTARPPPKKIQPIRWGPEEDALLDAARAAMPDGADATLSDVIRWALRVAPEASDRARRKAAAER